MARRKYAATRVGQPVPSDDRPHSNLRLRWRGYFHWGVRTGPQRLFDPVDDWLDALRAISVLRLQGIECAVAVEYKAEPPD
jgi:hypothetical protein